jgi:quinol monooxygenase YgiN
MPHVTTFRFKALPGKRDDVISLIEKWANEEQSNAPGMQEYSLLISNEDPDECMAYVCFDTTENYKKNSDRPAQDAWYRQLRALLKDDPEWFNGTIAIAIETTE